MDSLHLIKYFVILTFSNFILCVPPLKIISLGDEQGVEVGNGNITEDYEIVELEVDIQIVEEDKFTTTEITLTADDMTNKSGKNENIVDNFAIIEPDTVIQFVEEDTYTTTEITITTDDMTIESGTNKNFVKDFAIIEPETDIQIEKREPPVSTDIPKTENDLNNNSVPIIHIEPCSLSFKKFASNMRLRRLKEMAKNFRRQFEGSNKVRRSFPGEAEEQRNREIESLLAKVPCQWSCWSSWSTCSVTCGGGGTRMRSREVAVPPTKGGRQCQASHAVQNGTCGDLSCPPPEDCKLSDWGQWTSCSVSCGEGQKNRNRSIVSEARYGGSECSAFKLNESMVCEDRECPVDCAWSAWGEWSSCSVSCGNGTQARERLVESTSRSGGKDCVWQDSKHLKICTEPDCPAPVDCEVSSWSSWSSCSVSCGMGDISRSRNIVSAARHGGIDCSTLELQENKMSVKPECPFNCIWGPWAAWSPCSVSCGKGTRFRGRTVESPARNGGRDCDLDDNTHLKLCSSKECPDCPRGWSRLGNNCYLKGEYSRNWYQAEKACTMLHPKSHLVSLHSSEQAKDLVMWDQFEQCVWLGGQRKVTLRRTENNSFSWSDGSPFNFTMWHLAVSTWDSRRQDEGCILGCTNNWDNELSWTVQMCDLTESFVPYICHISLGILEY